MRSKNYTPPPEEGLSGYRLIAKIIKDASVAIFLGFLIFLIPIIVTFLLTEKPLTFFQYVNEIAGGLVEIGTLADSPPAGSGADSNSTAGSETFLLKAIGFLTGLGIINYFFDYVSAIVSINLIRALSRDLSENKYVNSILHILYDVIFALIMLFALAIVAISLFDALNLRWATEWQLYQHNPFGADAFPWTVMLASTFLFTAIHFFLAVFALLNISFPLTGKIVSICLRPDPTYLEKVFVSGWAGANIILSIALAISGSMIALRIITYDTSFQFWSWVYASTSDLYGIDRTFR